MTHEELRQIRLFRQHLTDKTNKITVARDLCGIQCQFMSNAFHSLKIRCTEPLDPETFSEGLVKNWTHRGTVHVFPTDDLPLYLYDEGVYRSEEWNDEYYKNRIWVSGKRKRFFVELILKSIENGTCEREALRTICRENGMTQREENWAFDPWGGIFHTLCKRGFLNHAVGERKAFVLSPIYTPMTAHDAKREQLRRYLTHIAPATLRDISYFFKFTQAEIKSRLSELPVEHFTLDGKEHFYLEPLKTDYPDIPPCIFLAGFDQLMLGYQKADSIFLPAEYLRGIFNLAGIVMPAVMLDGTVAGKWKKKGKILEITPFRTFSAKEKTIVSDTAEALWGDEMGKISFLGIT